MPSLPLDLTGLCFGNLLVLRRNGVGPNKQRMWLVECRCSTLYSQPAAALWKGNANGRRCAVCGIGGGRAMKPMADPPAVGFFPGVGKRKSQ